MLERSRTPALLAAMVATALAACGEISAVQGEPSPPGGDTSAEEWDRLLAHTVVAGDVVVPDGERWLIGPGVQIEGNLRTVNGTIAMRPGSSLRFLGADPSEYVGGGMHYEDAFARDIGLWVGGRRAKGVLDIRCTPKEGWNRTGTHPTWEPDDEYWIAPTDPGDFTPRRWYPGDPIPQVDSRVPPAEVLNVSRDCVIHGPGHIHIHSSAPSRVEYVRLQGLGISIQDGRRDAARSGRYALHLHMSGRGSRGTRIQGVAAVDSRGRVFVPHTSHGVTMVDNVSVNSWAEGFWWDDGDRTNDIVVDRLAVVGVSPPWRRGQRPDVIALPDGENMVMRNSVASGGLSRGNFVNGFFWTGGASLNRASPVWDFDQGNVAHNNKASGIRFWTNTRHDHHVRGAVTYRNGFSGLYNGAYRNGNRWTDVVSLEDGIGLVQHSNSNPNVSDDGPARYERVRILAPAGPAIRANGRQLEAQRYVEYVDSEFEPGRGHPVVSVERGGHPWLAHFIRSGVTPDDFGFPDLSSVEGTRIRIDHEDGRRWEIRIQGGRKIVTER